MVLVSRDRSGTEKFRCLLRVLGHGEDVYSLPRVEGLNLRRMGRRVAMLPAKMPRPVSMLDQIAMGVVAPGHFISFCFWGSVRVERRRRGMDVQR